MHAGRRGQDQMEMAPTSSVRLMPPVGAFTFPSANSMTILTSSSSGSCRSHCIKLCACASRWHHAVLARDRPLCSEPFLL